MEPQLIEDYRALVERIVERLDHDNIAPASAPAPIDRPFILCHVSATNAARGVMRIQGVVQRRDPGYS